MSSLISISPVRSITTLIPDHTPRHTLLRLRQRYSELGESVPAWYILAVVQRIDALLASDEEAA